jgi:hypothetical protein
VDPKLGLRFISKMNQQPKYQIVNIVESVKQTKQIGVSMLSEYFLFAFYFQVIPKRFQLCFAISG